MGEIIHLSQSFSYKHLIGRRSNPELCDALDVLRNSGVNDVIYLHKNWEGGFCYVSLFFFPGKGAVFSLMLHVTVFF